MKVSPEQVPILQGPAPLPVGEAVTAGLAPSLEEQGDWWTGCGSRHRSAAAFTLTLTLTPR